MVARNFRRHRLQFNKPVPFKRILLKPCSRVVRNSTEYRKQSRVESISEKTLNFCNFEFLKSDYIFSLSKSMNHALNLSDVCTIIAKRSN